MNVTKTLALTALLTAPLPVLAQVVGMSPEALKTELASKGHPVLNDQQTLQDLIGGDLRAQIQTITGLTKASAQP